MQRYRINYRLLIGLFVGSIVLSITLHFVWKWQVNRKANRYRESSQAALASNDTLKAFKDLKMYLRLRRQDESARIELATIASDIAVMDGVSREDKGNAFGVLSDTVRRTSDPGLRRKLADLHFFHGRPQDAITHYNELLNASEDPELRAMHARSLFRAKDYNKAIDHAFKLIGYDKLAKEFNSESATAANQPELYSALAEALLQQDKDIELARQVIDQMVALNPDSAIARLRRSVFLYGVDEKEEATAELNKAFELDPEDADVLYRKAEVAYLEENHEDARRFANEGIEKFADEMRFYRLLSRVELLAEQYDDAIAVLDKAIQQFGDNRSIEFVIFKIDVLLANDDTEGTEQIIRDLEKLEIANLKPLIEYQRARVLFQEGQWAQAAEILRDVRPQLSIFGRTQALAGTLLGEAYEKLGKLDLARQVYEIVGDDEVLSSSSTIKRRALAKVQQINKRLGLGDGTDDSTLNSIIQKMKEKPEEEQDWQEIEDFINDLVENRDLTEVQVKLLRAEVFTQREMLAEAKDMIRQAAKLDPTNVGVRYAAVKLMLLEPPSGPLKALKLLKKIEQDFGVTITSRSLMVDTLVAIGDDDLLQQLQALTDGSEDWSDQDKMRLAATLGLKFLQFNEIDEAVQYLSQAAKLDPSNLPLRNQLFEIAFQRRDDEAMRKAQEQILELVGSKEDSNYVLSEVKRRLIGYKPNDEASRIELLEVRGMLDDALEKRPEWHELHVLYGQVLLALQEDLNLALQHLNDALKYGRPNAHAVGLLVRLLAQRGDIQQAYEKMQLIPEAVRGRLLGKVEAEILLASGDLSAAFESAQAEADRNPEDAATQAWLGGIAERTNNLDVAASAFRQACELMPTNHNFWTKLVATHARRKDFLNMEASLRDAQLALDPEFLPTLQAKFFEVQGRWNAAEGIYLDQHKNQLDNPAAARQLAEFYLNWSRSDKRNASIAIQKAFPYINRILRTANEGELKFDNPVVLWAREQAARILAGSGSYQNSLNAQQLLEQGSADGKVPREYRALYSEILSSRADPISVLAAIDLLSGLNQKGLLDKKQLLLLARLYARTNNWKKGKPLMLDALSRFGPDPEVWSTYIELLIGRGEYNTAAQRLRRFEDLGSNSAQVFNLRTRLAYERGDQAAVRRLLQSMLPANLGPSTPLDEEQLKMVQGIGAVAVNYEEYELAEQLLTLYFQRTSEGLFDLLTVFALHGDADKAIPIMQQLVKDNPDAVAQLAVQMIRQRRSEFGDRFDQPVSDLVLSVWKEEPDLARRLALRAEMYEVMEKYDEAIAAYEDIVSRDDLPPKARAAASNNLAYLFALRNQQLDRAQELIEKAIEILGPLADVLDTRAVIRIARKEYDLAVEDMTLALSLDPTAVKYYHMAKAQALAGNEGEALEAWSMANEMEIEEESLPLIEQSGYQETKQLIENLSP